MKIETHAPFQITFKKRPKTEMIVVHCAATQPKKDIDWRTIDAMHRQRGFLAIGYHFVITVDGAIQEGRPLDVIGAHASGHNSNSIGICLVGGVDKDGKATDNFTKKQKQALDWLVRDLVSKYPTIKQVLGHRDLPNVKKDCPCFDVKSLFKKLF